MRSYLESWPEDEITEYLNNHGVLVLFIVDKTVNLAYPVVHGLTDNESRETLVMLIMGLFASTNLNQSICVKINELAEKWYNKNILKKKSRVINFKKKGKV